VIRPTAPGSPYRLPGLWRRPPRSPQFAGTLAAELFRRQQSRDPHARRARQRRITSRRAASPPRMAIVHREGLTAENQLTLKKKN